MLTTFVMRRGPDDVLYRADLLDDRGNVVATTTPRRLRSDCMRLIDVVRATDMDTPVKVVE